MKRQLTKMTMKMQKKKKKEGRESEPKCSPHTTDKTQKTKETTTKMEKIQCFILQKIQRKVLHNRTSYTKPGSNVLTNVTERTRSAASSNWYLLGVSTSGCLGLLPFLPLHEVLRRLAAGGERVLGAGLRHCGHQELRGGLGLQQGDGGQRALRRTQVVDVQAVPVASLHTICLFIY